MHGKEYLEQGQRYFIIIIFIAVIVMPNIYISAVAKLTNLIFRETTL